MNEYDKGGKYWNGHIVSTSDSGWLYSEQTLDNIMDRLSRAAAALAALRGSESPGPQGQDVVTQPCVMELAEAFTALYRVERLVPDVECWVVGYTNEWHDGWMTWHTWGGFLSLEQAQEFACEWSEREQRKYPHHRPKPWYVTYGPCPLKQVYDPDAETKHSGGFLS